MNIEDLLDRPIAFQRAFVKLGAGAYGALFLSQAVYWSNRTSDQDKWFYKTMEDWEDEVGLTRSEQETARKKLRAIGVLQEVKKGVPCRLFYRVNFDAIRERLSSRAQQSSLRESCKLDCGNHADKNAEIPQASTLEPGKQACGDPASITENTTEITSFSAQEAAAPDLFESNHYLPMTLDWKPDVKILKAYAFAQGVNLALITTTLITSFACHHSAHPGSCDTSAGWANRLVKWAKNERVRNDSAHDQGAPIPVQEVVDLYHQHCPRMSVVTVIDKKIRGLIAERWAEHEAHQDLTFWADYFVESGTISEVFYRGHKRFPFLEALLSRDVFRDVMEGRVNA